MRCVCVSAYARRPPQRSPNLLQFGGGAWVIAEPGPIHHDADAIAPERPVAVAQRRDAAASAVDRMQPFAVLEELRRRRAAR